MFGKWRPARLRAPVLGSVVAALLSGTILATSSMPTATAGASRGPSVTLTVAYWSGFNPAGTNIMPAWIAAAGKQLQKTYPNVKVVGEEITTNSESEYYSKLDLTERSARTVPDVVFEDSFLIGSDASAGFIRPLPTLSTWSGWSSYYPAMKSLVTYNGKVYGAMNSTDVQLIFYSKKLFRQAGLPTTWQPRNWQDVLSAGRALARASRSNSGVVPLWVYTGQAVGEASAFRGFEVFLNGTKDRLYDYTTHKWEITGPGFDATWKLLAKMQPIEEPESMWSNPLADATVALTLMPHQQVGMVFDGSWVATAYVPNGLQPWPGFFSAYGEAALPTSTGAAPKYTNQSGGWALSVPALAPHAALSQAYIEAANAAPLLAGFDPATGNLPPRADVLTQPAWRASVKVNPVSKFASAQLPFTTFRPNLPAYVQVSNVIQQLTGAISSRSMTPQQAAAAYASKVTQIVGAGNVERMKQ
jgi:multiple sugar transport system substrate-binding protein